MLKIIQKAGWLVTSLVSLAGLLVLILVFLMFFISPIVHWSIEKYAPEYTGRQVAMRHLHIGLLTGKIQIDGLRMMEANRSDTFVYAGDATIRISIRKALFGQYQIDSVTVDTLTASINQSGERFNFDDLLLAIMAPDSNPPPPSTDTIHYTTGKIAINNITLRYRNKVPSAEIALTNGHLQIPSLSWNDPIIRLDASAHVNQEGTISAEMTYDQTSTEYTLLFRADSVSTRPLFPYMASFLNSKRAEGLFSTQLEIKGTGQSPTQLAMKGRIALDRFVLTNADDEKQVGWTGFSIEIDSLNTNSNLYRFNNVVLSEPFILVTLTKKGNNFTSLMRQAATPTTQPQQLEGVEATPLEYANPFIMLAEMIGQIAEQYSKNEYGMNRFAIENGTIVYNDFLTNEKFSVLFQEFNAQTASFNDTSQAVRFDINTLMNRYGNVKAQLSVDNRTFKDFDLTLAINSLTMSVFNPYTKYYIAYPFWRGDISFNTTLAVKDGQLKSNNHLLIKQIKVGERINNDSAFSMPVKLAVAILRDRKGNIDLEIPIEGSLSDPNYRWGKAVLKIVGNLLVKAVMAPWDFLSAAIGGNPDDLKMIEFDPLQDTITQAQQRNLNAIAKVLHEKPDLILKLTFRNNQGLERDEVALRSALNMWHAENLISTNAEVKALAEKTTISSLSVNDPLFQKWLTQITGISSPDVALSDRCLKATGGVTMADAAIKKVDSLRDNAVRHYLVIKHQIPSSAIIVEHPNDEGKNRNTPRPTYDVSFEVK